MLTVKVKLREEGRATMHVDPYSGRCYFRFIFFIEEGRIVSVVIAPYTDTYYLMQSFSLQFFVMFKS